MDIVFYLSSAVAIIATLLVITGKHAVHALLYLIVSLLAVAVVLFTLGAPFVAALEVIVYAGAIMVLFVFVVMMLNLGPQTTEQESRWLRPRTWVGPSILAVILIAELGYALLVRGVQRTASTPVPIEPVQVGMALFGPYVLGVELASMLLLAGLVGAYHLGRRERVSAAHPGEEPVMSGGNGNGREREAAFSSANPRESAPSVKSTTEY